MEEITEDFAYDDNCEEDCHPMMDLAKFNTYGQLTIEFDRSMVVPEQVEEWTGQNVYLVGKQFQNATCLADNDCSSLINAFYEQYRVIDFSVFPGEL